MKEPNPYASPEPDDCNEKKPLWPYYFSFIILEFVLLDFLMGNNNFYKNPLYFIVIAYSLSLFAQLSTEAATRDFHK